MVINDWYFLIFIITSSEQILLTSENWNEPICDRKGLFYEYSFNEIRLKGFLLPTFPYIYSFNSSSIYYKSKISVELLKSWSRFILELIMQT